jgi:hypothetical protein
MRPLFPVSSGPVSPRSEVIRPPYVPVVWERTVTRGSAVHPVFALDLSAQ